MKVFFLITNNKKGDSQRFRLSPIFLLSGGKHDKKHSTLTCLRQLDFAPTRHSPQVVSALGLIAKLNFSQCFGQLVGAGGAATTAVDPFEAGDGLLDLHPLHECRYALRVAVATANERHLANRILLDGQDDRL